MIIEPNTKTDFFYVDGEYIEYLKNVEESNRGFTCVPNVHCNRSTTTPSNITQALGKTPRA